LQLVCVPAQNVTLVQVETQVDHGDEMGSQAQLAGILGSTSASVKNNQIVHGSAESPTQQKNRPGLQNGHSLEGDVSADFIVKSVHSDFATTRSTATAAHASTSLISPDT